MIRYLNHPKIYHIFSSMVGVLLPLLTLPFCVAHDFSSNPHDRHVRRQELLQNHPTGKIPPVSSNVAGGWDIPEQSRWEKYIEMEDFPRRR